MSTMFKIVAILLSVLVIFLFPVTFALAKEIEITMCHGIGAADHEVIKALFDQFNEEYRGKIKLTELLMGWEEVWEKIAHGMIIGEAPDMTVAHTTNMLRFVNQKMIMPLDELFDKYNIRSTDFIPGIWDEFKIGGKIYSIPWDIHTMVSWYNKDHFAEAGLDPMVLEERPISYTETLNFATKLLKKDASGRVTRWGVGFGEYRTCFWGFLWQFGGEMFDKEFTKCIVNSEAGLKALQNMYDLTYKYNVASPEGTDWDTFRVGKLSLHIDGTWWIMGFKAQKGLNFGLGLFPTFGYKNAVRKDSHSFAVVNLPRTQEQLDAYMTFFKWMTEHSAIWGTAGHVPANKKAAESDIFKNVYEMSVAKKQLPWARYPDITIISSEMWEFTRQELDAALKGQKTVKKALDDLAARLTKVIQEAKAGK